MISSKEKSLGKDFLFSSSDKLKFTEKSSMDRDRCQGSLWVNHVQSCSKSPNSNSTEARGIVLVEDFQFQWSWCVMILCKDVARISLSWRGHLPIERMFRILKIFLLLTSLSLSLVGENHLCTRIDFSGVIACSSTTISETCFRQVDCD